MTRFTAVFCFLLVAVVALGGSALAAGERANTHSESFLAAHHTTAQVAIFGAYIACVPDADGDGLDEIDTAISFSNIMAMPAEVGGDGLIPARVLGDTTSTSGGVTVYLYEQMTGDVTVVDSGAELAPGQTYSALFCGILNDLEYEGTWTGYGWAVADFGAVSGTVTNLWNILGVGGTYLMQPPLGGVPVMPTAEPF